VDAAPAAPSRRLADLALCLLFAAGIALPPLRCLLAPGPVELGGEKRRPAPMPEWKPSRNFPARFDLWYRDAFGFRPTLLRWHHRLLVGWLGESSVEWVVRGRHGWLYIGSDDSLCEYQGRRPFTPEQLERWRHALERRRDWLAGRGVRYLFVAVPNKQTIYPEHLPAGVRPGPASRLDQLLEHLRARSDVPVLDLRPVLREARGREPVYQRYDSHWNEPGAYAAYKAIIDALPGRVPGARPAWPRDAYAEFTGRGSGDLALALGMQDEWAEDCVQLAPLRPRLAHETSDGLDRLRELCPKADEVLLHEHPDPSQPRAVVFRDSFTIRLVPFLSEHFRRVAYVWQRPFSRRVVEAERPDVVLEIRCERFLIHDPEDEPEGPPEEGTPPAAYRPPP
jgi:alginate O-acetyltransferase complex protein AlgJ